MIGHLGPKVSALLDGRLPPVEEERAWEHVHTCHPCRDAVEREGWVKTRLAQLGPCPGASQTFSSALRESLLDPSFAAAGATYPDELPDPRPSAHPVRQRHLVALGGSAIGMAVLGVVALGAAPANAPSMERRGPLTSIVPPTSGLAPRPVSTPWAPASVRPKAFDDTMAP